MDRTTAAGPREDPVGGFRSFDEPIEGTKARVRSERFADHYSQARQFYVSQTRSSRPTSSTPSCSS